jgi:hypothetical protein
VRKKWLILPLVATLVTAAFLTWCAVEDARQKAALIVRCQATYDRRSRADHRLGLADKRYKLTRFRADQLARDGAPEDEVLRARKEAEAAEREAIDVTRERDAARDEANAAAKEYNRWQNFSPARLLREIRSRW